LINFVKNYNEMKKISLLILMLLAVQPAVKAQVSFGKPEKLNEQWNFYLGDNPDEQKNWRSVRLPHDWSIEGVLNPSLAACTGYLPGGIAWYRKTLTIPESSEGEKVYIYFEGVQNRSEVYLNGKLLGKRPNGYVSFLYDLTPYVKFGGENVLTVRVDHSQHADSRWYNGSGIYRNVWLVHANPVHIAQWGVYAYPKNISGKKGELNVEVEIENTTSKPVEVSLRNQLMNEKDEILAHETRNVKIEAGQKNKTTITLKVKNPELWDLSNPRLYTLETFINDGGNTIDHATTKTGFRTFTFDADNGFSLNGKNTKIKGVCIHHDAGVLGAAVPREVWVRRLKTLQSLGCNAIRLTHNLHNPDVYDLCDELGLLVMDEVFDEWEFPKRKWLQGWNVGTPGFQGASDYFAEWSDIDLADGVCRDRNHLSVFAWSIGNEVDYPNDPYSHPVLDGDSQGFTQKTFGGYRKDAPDANRLGAIAKRLTATVKKYDVTRPVTAGLAGVAMSNETEYPYVLDITGYNYTEDRYFSDHQKYPGRIIYGSENRHDFPAWKAVRDNNHISAQFLWTGIDYLGEAGVWPSRGFYSGLLDLAGYVKPRGYFRKALWSEEPAIYAGSYPNTGQRRRLSMDALPVWNYEEGREIRVVCYTNAKKTQLFLNNEPVGEMKSFDDSTGIIFWDIPFRAGKLTAKGYDSGNKEVCEYTIQTSGKPEKIELNACQTVIDKDRGVAQIEIQITDENGIPAVLADNELTCHIEGQGKLLGMEAGNNTDMGNYRDNVQRVFLGRMIAYVEATGAGEIKVKFTSPYLESAEIAVVAE
jgi:hypothetical protein